MRWYDNSTNRTVLCGIVVMAFVLRLVHLWTISQGAWIDRHLTATNADDYTFFQWAQTIVAGDWLGRDTYHPYFPWMQEIAPLEDWHRWWGGKEIFHQAPLYPYLLAGLLILFHGSVPFVLAIQMLIGSLQILIIYGIATRLFDQKVGLVSAAITALYGPFIFYQGLLLRDWLVPVVEPLAILVLLHARQRGGAFRWTLAGAALGLAVLCKASAVLLILVAFLWIIYDRWGRWRANGRTLALVLLGILLSISPLLARNVVVGAPTFSVSNRAMEAFVLWNAPSSSVIKQSQGHLSRAIMATVHYHSAGSLLALQLNKLNMLVSAQESPNNTSYDYGLGHSPLLRWMLGYGFLFPLGLAGLVLSIKSWRHELLFLLYGLAAFSMLLLTSPIARFRLSIIPFFVVFSALALVRFARAIHARHAGLAFKILALVAVSVLIQWTAPDRPGGSFYGDYHATISAYKKRMDFAAAAAEAARFYAAAQSNGATAEANKAAALEGDARVWWALQMLREGNAALANEQAGLAAAAYANHPNAPRASFNLGVLYAALGQNAKARALLKQFLETVPQHPRAAAATELLSRLQQGIGPSPAIEQR